MGRTYFEVTVEESIGREQEENIMISHWYISRLNHLMLLEEV